MTWETFARLPKEARSHFHRCPGCGELLDDRRVEEREKHYQHGFQTTFGGPPRQQQGGAAGTLPVA